jgi:hypothetical protein
MILSSLIFSGMSNRLSLGELIHAFCIIIFASYRTSLYCYLHQSFIIYAFLDDFQDFPTKSPPPSIFNFRETENLLFFLFWSFRDLLDLNLIGDFYSVNILSREASREVVAREESHEAQTSTCGTAHQAGRATRAHLALGGRLTSVFLWTPLFWQKRDTLFFP